MEYSFEVDPVLDIAVGAEIHWDDEGNELSLEDVSMMDATSPTTAKPGSEDKVRMLAARYAAGIPLWHEEDCYDHGPAEAFTEGEGHEYGDELHEEEEEL